jgi:hypothetical protein
MGLMIRLLVNAAALWVATRIVPGVTYLGEVLPFLAVALVFGMVIHRSRGKATRVSSDHPHARRLCVGRQRADDMADERAIGVARSRISRERILGGSIRIARGKHRQHGALGFRCSGVKTVAYATFVRCCTRICQKLVCRWRVLHPAAGLLWGRP